MVFDATDFKHELTAELIAAISYALETDAEVEIDEINEVRKVISTYTYSFHGQFAAGEQFGEFYGQYSAKDGKATLMQMKFKFGDFDTEALIKCASGQSMLNGISNAYNVYKTRKHAMPKIFPKLVEKLDEIDKIAADTKVEEQIVSITTDIRELFGTDIELVSTLPKEG